MNDLVLITKVIDILGWDGPESNLTLFLNSLSQEDIYKVLVYMYIWRWDADSVTVVKSNTQHFLHNKDKIIAQIIAKKSSELVEYFKKSLSFLEKNENTNL